MLALQGAFEEHEVGRFEETSHGAEAMFKKLPVELMERFHVIQALSSSSLACKRCQVRKIQELDVCDACEAKLSVKRRSEVGDPRW